MALPPRYYTLTLSQDGQTLYAANAALGTIATVNLDLGPNAYQLWLIPNARLTHFNPGISVVTAADQTRELHNGAALSRDQNLLYVVGLHGIWVINTNTLKVQGQYLKQQDFTGWPSTAMGRCSTGLTPRPALPCSTLAAGIHAR